MSSVDIKKLLNESDNAMDAQASYIVQSDAFLYFGVNFRMPSPNDGIDNYCYVVAYDVDSDRLLWTTKLVGNKCSINDNPVLIDESIIAVSTNQIAAMDKDTGAVIWERKFKKSGGVKLSTHENRLFVSNWGELAEIDISTGNTKKSVKPRVKWFDSGVVAYESRFFVSTANSKILELDESLNVVQEFKFPGGWAIGCAPLIHGSKMVSSSYGAKSIVFDLNSNEVEKRFKKTSGSRPNHLLIGDCYILHESLVCNKLTCFSLSKRKKLWSNDLAGIQGVWKKDDNSAFIVFEKDDSYVAGIIDVKGGNVTSILDIGNLGVPSAYKFGLWDGISINRINQCILLNYNPGLIKIFNA
ncbi:MAG: PQQ-binding-like beta-propeller repeat protein [Gammaproteobacteria bacterium]|nr:PQQ-binding-like beta-propeller repeat protein [Gammaproteobacteria bacterium]